ncbi:CPBP family intramembrane glutamic endopeptidase [Brachybacterium phenoliresistens]|uniref:CPBP family intramembrane glutamic endopeptidase n=1 Tax=Brachybacterium phenoliresistens TaxID=396014 RepID=UPI0022B442AA|nr:CPBP family intramembrane glutamic endopeptidase [Brachybacterium phenoliresistens]
MLVAGVLTAAVTEEVIFRAVPMELLLRRRFPSWAAVLVPLIAFTLAHAGSWSPAHVVGVVMPLGLLLGLVYLRWRSLGMCMVVHLLVDAPLVLVAIAAG